MGGTGVMAWALGVVSELGQVLSSFLAFALYAEKEERAPDNEITWKIIEMVICCSGRKNPGVYVEGSCKKALEQPKCTSPL